MHTVLTKGQSCKQEPLLRCPHCATSLIIRYGTYQRAHPEESIQVKIQRFVCKSPLCPRLTFSVLPHPFLPIVRHFFQTLLCCHFLCNIDKRSQAEGVRRMGLSRGVIKRLSAFGKKFTPWFNHEKKIADWGPYPNNNPPPSWSDFTRDFSLVFYPKRWPMHAPTQ